jgi:hypothetical protein
MKKYPVHYKGKEYEVRWEHRGYIAFITIYEVRRKKAFKYKEVFSIKAKSLNQRFFMDDPLFYVKEVKLLFDLWEKRTDENNKKELIQQLKEETLENWDGIIE